MIDRRRLLKIAFMAGGYAALWRMAVPIKEALAIGAATLPHRNRLRDSGGSGCSQGSAGDQCSSADESFDVDATDARGFDFVAQSSYSSWGITLGCKYSGTSGDINVRIGTSSDLSTYLGKTTLTVSGTQDSDTETGQWLDSGDSPTCIDISSSTTYYVGYIGVSGTLYVMGTSTSPCSNVTYRYASSGWQLGSQDIAYDTRFTIIQNGG
jgi:hypothetical protein